MGEKKNLRANPKKKKIRKRCSKELKKNQYFIPDFYAGKEVVFFLLKSLRAKSRIYSNPILKIFTELHIFHG